MIFYAAPKDYFAIRSIFDNFVNFIFGYGISMTDLFKYEYYMIQETPFGVRNRFLENAKALPSLIAPTSPILQILVNGGFLGFLIIFYKFKKIFKSMDKPTIIYTLSIFTMCLFSSILIFSIGLFLISVSINYRYKSYIFKNEEKFFIIFI